MKKEKDNLAVRTTGLSKDFDSFQAVKNVNLQVEKKEIYALVGPNGAGKTTLIKMLVGLLLPTTGQIEIDGIDILKSPEKAKAKIGYVSDDPIAYPFLTGEEFIILTARLRGMTKEEILKKLESIKKVFSIGEIFSQPMVNYSRGNREKIAFLSALIASPEILIIDEPIVGLDPQSIEILGEKIKSFAQSGGTVFFATHILPFAQKYATKVAIINHGEIVWEEKINPSTQLVEVYKKIIE
jgi:ABC-2 type transport system ATP-binding protein